MHKSVASRKVLLRFKQFFKLYYLGILIMTIIISLVFLIFFFSDQVKNLEEGILVASLLSPYMILYLQHINIKKKKREKLGIIANKVTTLIKYIQSKVDVLDDINSVLDMKLNLKSLSLEEQTVIKSYFKMIPKLISDLNYPRFTADELLELNCVITDPKNTFLQYAKKYYIGVKGIIEIDEWKNISSNKEKITSILEEIAASVF